MLLDNYDPGIRSPPHGGTITPERGFLDNPAELRG